jgi:hypothetical protein
MYERLLLYIFTFISLKYTHCTLSFKTQHCNILSHMNLIT